MAQNSQNILRLEKAGLLNLEQFSDADRKVLDGMSDEEVDVLIRLKHKLGAAPVGKDHLRPNIIV